MVVIQKEHIESIPVLHLVNHDQQSDKLPFVIFIHGFTSAKEHNLHYAYLLAEKGFRVLLPEALYHGERDLQLKEQDLYLKFWEIVLNTIHEIKTLKNYFSKMELIDEDRIGVAGTSMGGIATLGALTQFEWIKAAVCLMGMPSYVKFSHWQIEQIKKQGYSLELTQEKIDRELSVLAEYDLSLQKEKLANRPLLFWHGQNDHMVPYIFAREFYESVKDSYSESPEKLEFITDQLAGHKVSKSGVKATVDWFNKYL